MALEAVVFQPDVFGYKDVYNLLGANWGSEDFGVVERDEEEKVRVDILGNQTESCYYADWNWNSTVQSSMAAHVEAHTTPFSELDMTSPVLHQDLPQLETSPTMSMSTRPRRRRTKTRKNKEDIENQRMTHIAVERNRRKQMNDYLSVLRSLMPDSYVPRGDQASIIGGAINYVKELEQRLQYLGGNKHMTTNNGFEFETAGSSSSSPFSDFFAFPQYSTGTTCGTCMVDVDDTATATATTTTPSAMADIEVSMVETHAHLKIRSKRRPKQLLKMISGLQTLSLTILHLNVTTIDQIVLYSLSVKVEDDCKLMSVGEIATAVNQILGRIQEEAHLI